MRKNNNLPKMSDFWNGRGFFSKQQMKLRERKAKQAEKETGYPLFLDFGDGKPPRKK